MIFFCSYLSGQASSHQIIISNSLYGRSNIVKHTILEKRYEPLKANSFSIKYEFGFSNNFSLSSGISIEQRGARFTSLEREIIGETPPLRLGDTILRNNKNHFTYIAIPLTIKYYFSLKNLSFFLNGGGYTSFLVNRVWDFDNNDKFTLIERNVLQFNYSSIDYGLIAGMGVGYKITDNFGIILDYQFQKGLKNVFEDDDIKGYHIRNVVELGLKIRVGKKQR